ncbi:MAG: hypothetical protein GY789_02370 [Hyphomicrobiales bacterium]|nr:hypothetical protein [Hyphomicrobiales bacterium]MCP5000059.1 hypothetical protein [Hyphomicrobiales bacterium]
MLIAAAALQVALTEQADEHRQMTAGGRGCGSITGSYQMAGFVRCNATGFILSNGS